MERPEDTVEIVPKGSFLRAAELITARNIEIDQFKLGLKRTLPSADTSAEEKVELERLYAQLAQQLAVPRIERLGGRSLAVWEPQTQAVRVLRKDGKFETFGYSSNGKDYLEFYEALFLLELNRLQLEYQSLPVSIEQAYLLLLGEKASAKYDDYLVYSTLSRAGYILEKHKNVQFVDVKQRTPATEIDCIWELLLESVQNKPLSERVRNSKLLPDIKKARDAIHARIKQQTSCESEEPSTDKQSPVLCGFSSLPQKVTPSSKRPTDERNEPGSSKRQKVSNSPLNGSLIDCLLSEPEYAKCKDIFHKLGAIKMKQSEDIDEDAEGFRHFEIRFDVYLHNSGFKKSVSCTPPLFRVIILSAGESFPTHDEISVCHRRQVQPLPLVVVSISESKQIHAFLYHIS